LAEAQEVLKELTSVMGLNLELPEIQGGDAEEFINLLIEIRKILREQKLWELSDLIRDNLEDLGVLLEDTSQGTTWHWK
jgi:cysteinyl-tRNA synthetase